MSRTITISSWSASNVTVRCSRRVLAQPDEDLGVHLGDAVAACDAGRRGRGPRRSRRGSPARPARCEALSIARGCLVRVGPGAVAHSRAPRRRGGGSSTSVAAAERGAPSAAPATGRPGRTVGERPAARASASSVSCSMQRPIASRSSTARCDRRGSRRAAVWAASMQPPHLVVDAGRDLVASSRARGEVAAEEHLALGLAEAHADRARRSCRTR